MNLRKDHCRNLQKQNDPRTRPFLSQQVRPSGGFSIDEPRSTAPNEPRRDPRQGIRKLDSRSDPSRRRPVRGRGRRRRCRLSVKENTKRLSTTDISALASMKNVAKCDTWCELQNPVNHRVFERKLRPKPLGRGHVCLGVTHRVAPPRASRRRGSGYWPPVPLAGAAGLKRSPRRRTHDDWWFVRN